MAYEVRWKRTGCGTDQAVTRGRILLKPLPTSSARVVLRVVVILMICTNGENQNICKIECFAQLRQDTLRQAFVL